jgi:predicted metal-dependent hydrolase
VAVALHVVVAVDLVEHQNGQETLLRVEIVEHSAVAVAVAVAVEHRMVVEQIVAVAVTVDLVRYLYMLNRSFYDNK